MSCRKSFVEHFGEETALALEAAAREHENGMHPNQGNDPFQWTIMLAISYQCAEIDSYREYHGIEPSWADIKAWIIEHADMASYNGDVDSLALVVGAYEPFLKREADV